MTKEQSTELVRKAQRGNRDAFEELIQAKQRQILFLSYAKIGNMHDAEEVAQESIIAIFRHLDGLKNPEAFDAWLHRIIISNCHKHLRKYGVLKTETDADDEAINVLEEGADFIPEEYAEKEELRREVYQVVMSLPEARRDAILMYYYEDMSLKEIAEATGVAEATTASTISRARKMIKEKIGELNKEEDLTEGAASSTTLGRILRSAAVEVIPDDRLAVFEQNWTGATRLMNFGPAKSTALNNAAIAVTCAVVITTAIVITMIAQDSDSGEIAAAPAVTHVADAEMREIVFSGNDCECGHINPTAVMISELNEGDSELTWTITGAGGETIFSGDTDGTNATLAALSAAKADGRYAIQCVFSDTARRTITLDRTFITGNYHGDSENTPQ